MALPFEEALPQLVTPGAGTPAPPHLLRSRLPTWPPGHSLLVSLPFRCNQGLARALGEKPLCRCGGCQGWCPKARVWRHHLAVMVLFEEIGGRSENGGRGAAVVLILGVRGGYLAARRWQYSSLKRTDRREGLPKGNSISQQPLAHSLC